MDNLHSNNDIMPTRISGKQDTNPCVYLSDLQTLYLVVVMTGNHQLKVHY